MARDRSEKQRDALLRGMGTRTRTRTGTGTGAESESRMRTRRLESLLRMGTGSGVGSEVVKCESPEAEGNTAREGDEAPNPTKV